ncbi:hypothetical protein [Rickettsiella endosymbiont of Xylota segnis]|uniref:hypothetical protein n=1 Tax=Rickettsiella endosymbiont of Xylota segnis TaxID=3066238 RepID=UPI0030D2F67F
MKPVNDPDVLKQLESKSNSNFEINQHNPVFNFLAGAGGALQNSLANLPYSPVHHAPSSQGLSGKIGDIAGNLLGFVGGGEALNAARAASEGLPFVGQLAKSLGGEGLPGIARRLLGTSMAGALENPNDRMEGATKGALWAGVGESVPLALKGIHQAAEFIHPQAFTNKLVASLKNAYENSKAEATKRYGQVLGNIGSEKIKAQTYPQLHQDILTAFDAKLKDLHQDFTNNSSLEKAHQLQSQLGSKIGQLSTSKHIDIHTHNAITHLKQARAALQTDINSFLQQTHPDLFNQYQQATRFYKNTVIPYHAENFISKIAQGDIKTAAPKKLNNVLMTLSEKASLPSDHTLQTAHKQLENKMNRGKMTSQLASLLAGAGLGELTHPGGFGALGGLIGGGAAHHYVLPKLLDLAANPYATQQVKNLKLPYQLLMKSLIANQLNPNNKEAL